MHQSVVLKISLFGCPKVFYPERGAETTLGKKANELLALLLLRGTHAHHREKLATTLWSESPPDSAAHSFRTTLWRLRQVLEPPGVLKGTFLYTTQAGEVGFNWQSQHLVDVLEFQSSLSCCNKTNIDALTDGDLQSIEKALRLYEGELLEGHFDDWIIYERERLRNIYIHGLRYLMQAHMQRNNHQKAIYCGRQALAEDPLQESFHRDLMRSYVQLGQRSEAIKLYEQLSHTLATELNVPPAVETANLYMQILQLEGKTYTTRDTICERQIIDIVHALQSLLEGMEQQQTKLRHALGTLEALMTSGHETND